MLNVSEFVHLHVHTEYSLLDGMIRIKDLIERTASYQMPAVAVTDHGAMFGAVKFYQEARDRGIKPIVGCEVYVAPKSRKDRDAVGNHLVLLCKNRRGYKNLCRLVSAGFIEGFYYKPRIDMELLAEHNEGLFALSACLKGKVPQAILVEDHEGAEAAATELRDVFGEDRFFLELMENGIEDQRRVNVELIALAKKLGLGVVATNDCHYLTREMSRAHEALLCIQTGKTLSDEKRMRLATNEFYFRSPGEMKEKFAETPEAISNTIEIANRCNFDWDLETKHFPVFKTNGDLTIEEAFAKKARAGFEKRHDDVARTDPDFEGREEEYSKRLEEEIKVIVDMGFSGYFLIVADFVNHSKQDGIAVGPGRGSAAGSLVSYSLGITDINPLAYGLIFERFLNPERRELPDIDVDFCQERREDALRYVTEAYGGSEYVAQIITFGTMKARAVIRDVGRVMEVPYGEVDRIAKLIPEKADLAQALKQEPRLKEIRDNDTRIAELLELAADLEGIARHASVHAAGVVISDRPLTEHLPLYKESKEDKVVAQYDKKFVEKVGLIKFDLLGLKTLTQIRYCVELIRQNRGEEVDVDKLPLDDAETFKLLADGDAGGVFQLESSGMQDLLVRLSPERFEELIAVVALYRPGPLNSGFHEKFIERKHGRQKVEYKHPLMEGVLKETYGVLVYQEQVMEIAVRLAGYTMGEADNLRKAMGKKDAALMETQREKFIGGAGKKGIGGDLARSIFNEMAPFAEYGFNKSHAAAYAYIAFQTAYLKARYPVEFMASLLTTDIDNADKVLRYLKEVEDKEIEIEPPHVNTSGWKFGARDEKISFGLGAVKGVGHGAVEAIALAREEGGEFKSLFDFCDRVDVRKVNRKALESLVKAGAFDGPDIGRARIFAAIDKALESGHKALQERESGQTSLFDMLDDETGADFMQQAYPDVSPWSSQELLANEKEALGFYLTGHPLARYEKMMKMYKVVETTQVQFMPSGQEIKIGGIVTAKKEIVSKKGERMAFVTVTDLKGSIEVVVFASVFKEAAPFLEDGDRPVLVRGRVEVAEDRAKLLAGEIMPLEMAAERLPMTLRVTLNRTTAGKDLAPAIGSLIKSHSGRAKVVVHVLIPGRSETMIALGPDYRASPDERLAKALLELPGVDDVSLTAA